MQVLKSRTTSLCNVCYAEIPARVFSDDGVVYLDKTCPIHGYFKTVVEKDVRFYKRFYHSRPDGQAYFHCLTIPITFRCDLQCKFCYVHNCKQTDYDLTTLERIINNFPGYEIGLSGGEPTLRDDLTEIIKIVKRAKKRCVLITHGLRLADKIYLAKLKEAGLVRVFFSLDSLKPLTYEIFKAGKSSGQKMLDLKMYALKNLEEEKIETHISVTLYPGVNDEEIKELLHFCLRNNRFIFDLRIRSCAEVGRYMHYEKIYLSSLLDKFSEALSVNRDKLVDSCLKKEEYHTINHIQLCIRGLLIDGKFFPFLSDETSKADNFKKIIFILNILSKIKLNQALRVIIGLFTKRLRLKHLTVRLVFWPTKENIDLQENDRGIAHLYDYDKIAHFCHAIIMLDKPLKPQEALTE